MKRKNQSGVAIIEFALIIPFILILALVAGEFGRALYQYNRIVKQVRNAVRYMSTEAPDDPIATDRARKLVVYGNVAGTGDPIDPGVTTDKVAIPPTTFTGAAPSPVMRTVTVTVTGYTFTPIFSSFFGANFSQITFNDISATMRHPL